jgi:hypothetical protein
MGSHVMTVRMRMPLDPIPARGGYDQSITLGPVLVANS